MHSRATGVRPKKARAGILLSFLLSIHQVSAADTFSDLGFSHTLQNYVADEVIKSNAFEADAFLAGSDHRLESKRVLSAHGVETHQYQHFYKGLEVLGGVASVHLKTAPSAGRFSILDTLKSIGGEPGQFTETVQSFDLSTTPVVTEDEAVRLASQASAQVLVDGRPQLKVLPGIDGVVRLIYWVAFETTVSVKGIPSSDVLVDAHTGQILAEVPHILTITPFRISSAAKVPDQWVDPVSGAPRGIPEEHLELIYEDSKLVGKTDESADRALKNAVATMTYYSEAHGRKGFDGNESEIHSIVHVGRKFPNAFWNPKLRIMGYGDGDGLVMGDMTRARDVAGHEITHAVVSSTSNLIGVGESGALNEALADFFGVMIDGSENWALGKDLYLKEEHQKLGIRNLKDPSVRQVRTFNSEGKLIEKPFPAHMKSRFIPKGFCNNQNDYCYVHVNATIPGHLMYLVSKSLGREKAQKLFYLVMTQHLNKMSGFAHFRDSSLEACKLLLPEEDCVKVKSLMSEVGL